MTAADAVEPRTRLQGDALVSEMDIAMGGEFVIACRDRYVIARVLGEAMLSVSCILPRGHTSDHEVLFDDSASLTWPLTP